MGTGICNQQLRKGEKVGKLILCKGEQSAKPYCFRLTNTNVYSIEELCYYIYHNVTTLSVELRDIDLVDWIEQELGLVDRAKKLRELVLTEAGIKDIVVCILLSCDYYGEEEIKELLKSLDEFVNLSPLEISIKRADHCLQYKQYAKAMVEYEKIRNDDAFALLKVEDRARVLHNMGISIIHCKGLLSALSIFKEVYDIDSRKEYLRSYLLTLLLLNEEKMVIELQSNEKLKEVVEEIQNEYIVSLKKAEDSIKDGFIKKIKEDKEKGKVIQFQKDVYNKMEDMKKKYRQDNL